LSGDPNGDHEAAEGKEHALPVGEPAPAVSLIEPIQPTIPAPLPELEIPAEPQQPPNPPSGRGPREPLDIRIVGDNEPKETERQTVAWTRRGVIVAFLALVVASGGGWLVYQQFKEMAAQTDLLDTAARQARVDSNESSKTTSKQLALLQDQLTQQRQALEVDQRPWLKFEIGEEPNKTGLIYAFPPAGQPLKIPIRITNIGKTPAKEIKGALWIQLVRDKNEPVIPDGNKHLIFTIPGERLPIGGQRFPSEGWVWGVVYPDQMVKQYFSPVKIGPDGKNVEIPLTNPDFDDMGVGKLRIYALGEVIYHDMFGVAHWSRFCMGDPRDNLPVALRCTRFNSVDGNQSQNRKGQRAK
jgi:hypothetical protein